MQTYVDIAKPEVVELRPSGSGRDGATRDEILYSAARLIALEGYPACTMRSISKKIQMKAGSLYHHFRSKDEILLEIMNVGTKMLLDEVSRRAEELPEDADFEQKMRVAIRTHAACMVDKSMPFMRVYEHLPPIIKRQARVARKRYAEFWVSFMEAGKASNDVRADLNLSIFVPFLLSGLSRVGDWYRETMDLDEVADLIADMCLGGVLTEKSGNAEMLSRSKIFG